MAAIDNADVIEYKNEAVHSREEETNSTFYDNSEINIKSELDDTPIDYNVNEESNLKGTVVNFNSIKIKKEIELEEITAIDNADLIECKNEVDTLWEEETNLTVYDNNEINIKSELDDTPIDFNIYNEEANLKETVENVKTIKNKNECFENVNNIEIPEENFKKDYCIEITEKTVKNLSNIEIPYNLPGDYVDELHSEIPEGSPHCERSALRLASQAALDDHKKWSAERAHERTVKIIPRLPQPVVFNEVQFAKSQRVGQKKGAPFKKPKADLLNLKINSKASNPESVEIVYSLVNISGSGVKLIRKHDFHGLNEHMRTHPGEKPYSCTMCSKQFSRSSHLDEHMRTHTGEKPYSCTVCNKQFSERGRMNRHMRTHKGEKPYLCTVCKKQFSRSGHLDMHLRTHTGEKPYSCTVCKKQFIQSGDLNRHMRTHTGEKPYSCMVCSKQFSESGSLNKHMRIHTGEKPYSCKLCSKQFSRSNDLNTHMSTHTGEKPYSCSVCKKRFSTNSCWRHHSKQCH